MRVLFYCTTYYQLLVAIQLRLTTYREWKTCLWLTDHSRGVRNICHNLSNMKLFDEVKYVSRKDAWVERAGLTNAAKFRKVLSVVFRPDSVTGIQTYDRVIFFNPDIDLYIIANSIVSNGGDLEFFRMEEGLMSYRSSSIDFSGGMLRSLNLFQRIARQPCVSNEIQGFYCFIPELCPHDFPYQRIAIPPVNDNREELTTVLRRVFSYNGFPYSHKYIFFASSQEVDGTPTGESEIVFKLANCIGPDHFLVKMHPRDGRSVYKDAGISVMEDSYIPWEVVQLCEDLSTRVLLTCTSGAPLMVTSLLGDCTRGAYLSPSKPTKEERVNLELARASISATLDRLYDFGLCEGIVKISVDEYCQEILRCDNFLS